MSRIRRIAALALAAVCVLGAMTACDVESKLPGKKKTDVELIAGQWETAFDVSQTVKGLVTAADSLYAEADFAGLGLAYQITFNTDGTYTAGIAEDGLDRLLRDTAGRMAPVIREQYRRELAEQQHVAPEEISDEQLDGYAGMIGLGSWDSLCLEQLGRMLTEMDAVGPFEAGDISGRFALKDGLLCLSADPAAEATAEDWSSPYQLDAKTLTLQSGSTDGLPGFVAFPVTFSRVDEG